MNKAIDRNTALAFLLRPLPKRELDSRATRRKVLQLRILEVHSAYPFLNETEQLLADRWIIKAEAARDEVKEPCHVR